MFTEHEDVEYRECPQCHQEYISALKSGLCKLCLENAIENGDADEDDYPEDFVEFNQ
jgi:hypothetical protein